jgi:hypothetical protein
MAWKKRIRDSFSELKRGVSYPKGYDVDASLTSGIAMGKILALKSDGATKGTFGNETQPTWILADGAADEKMPYSVAYDTSLKNIYGALNLDESVVKMPRNATDTHESLPMDICRESIVEWFDDEDVNKLYYNTIKTTLTGTVEVGAGTLTTVEGTLTLFTTELAVGDYIVVGGEVRQVTVITNATTLTVGAAFTGAKAALSTIAKDTMIGKPVWVGTAGTAGDFVHLKPAYASDATKVGEILTGKHVLIKIK